MELDFSPYIVHCKKWKKVFTCIQDYADVGTSYVKNKIRSLFVINYLLLKTSVLRGLSAIPYFNLKTKLIYRRYVCLVSRHMSLVARTNSEPTFI